MPRQIRPSCHADDAPCEGHDDLRRAHLRCRGAEDAKRHLHPPLSGARFHRSILCSCPVRGRQPDRVVAHAGRLPDRQAIAEMLGIPIEQVRCIHMEGSGCYGHNGADDAAADAALLARAVPGRPVRVQWTREQEHGWEPYGPAMVTKVSAALDADGSIVELGLRGVEQHPFHASWRGRRAHCGAILGAALRRARAQANSSAGRRRRPQCDCALQAAERAGGASFHSRHALARLRAAGTGRLHERVLDRELHGRARASGRRRSRRLPAAASRRRTRPRRGRGAAERFGWSRSERLPRGHGRGFGFARYKNLAAYCAVAMEVEVAPRNRPRTCRSRRSPPSTAAKSSIPTG